ncbi:hypothetical protein WJX82_006484 [Trebouxia sp. C0006]
MPPSPLPASRSVSPDSLRAVSEQATLVEHLLVVARQLATQHQSLAGECRKETEAHEALLASRDAEIERVLAAEADLRQNYEQQLVAERQQWCQEKDALQKVLQEQQGTAHSLEQHLNAQIADLQAALARYESIQENVAHEELPSDDQQLNLTSERQSSDAGAADADASQEDPMALVDKLKRERELIKRGYNEEKKKADRYRNAYTQLRDMRQPAQRRTKQQRSASGAQSMPQLPGLDRQQGNAFQLSTDGVTTSGSAAALACNSSKPQKPLKVRKGPTEHNRFTAEMDLAAAGLLGQASKLTMDTEHLGDTPSKQVQQGLSWPLRTKRVLQQQGQQQQPSLSGAVEQQEEQQHRESQGDQQSWQRRSRQQQQQQQHASDSEELSPGAKEALILAGLLSEDQDPMPDDDVTEDPGTSALPRVSKVKATKWKQKGGQRAGAFAENDHPQLAAAVAVPRQQGGEAGQQCWLQSGVGGHEGAAVLGETAQRARVGGDFKYQEVVRGKADRAALQGIQCLDCRRFYEAVNTWGHEGQPLPTCGHTLLSGTAMHRGQGGSALPRQDLHQDASRHRYRFAPPATPNGFWDMGFGDSQDSRS